MRLRILMISLALAGCGSQEAAVEEVAAGPPEPEKLLYQDIENADIVGASCGFAPTGGGVGAIAIAMRDGGYMKIEGVLHKLAPMIENMELGPPEMKYVGDDYALGLTFDAESERSHGEGAGREYDAELLITATDGTKIYEGPGLVQCGA